MQVWRGGEVGRARGSRVPNGDSLGLGVRVPLGELGLGSRQERGLLRVRARAGGGNEGCER